MSGWKRPKGCSTNECIEVRKIRNVILLRTTEYSGRLSCTIDEWKLFVAAVKDGEFDVPEL